MQLYASMRVLLHTHMKKSQYADAIVNCYVKSFKILQRAPPRATPKSLFAVVLAGRDHGGSPVCASRSCETLGVSRADPKKP